MKKLTLLIVLLLTSLNLLYAQYSETFFTSNPNYKEELERSGANVFSIPATVSYKPLGIISWSEGFEGTTFPPTGWAVHQLDGGTQTWVRYTTTPIFGTASAAVRWESSTLSNNDWLVTPQFTVNPHTFLNFYAKRQSTAYNDSVEIYYSTTGGVPPSGYNYITTVMPSVTTGGELFQISLNALAGQNIFIAFRYKELDQFRLYIDSVYVETPVTMDAGVSSIIRPATFETTVGVSPTIVVRNFGINPTGTFQAYVRIEPGGYFQAQNVSSLNSGEQVQLTFPAWTPSTAGSYTVTAYTTLSGDMNPQNDTLRRTTLVFNEFPRDFVHNVSALYPGAISFYGIEFANDYFYVTKWNENKIFRINKAGTTIDSFTISGISATSGIRDLAWDGQYLYGSTASSTVLRIDINTWTATTAFTSPVLVRGIAYDKANDAFWVANWNTNIVLVNRAGATLQTITNTSHGLTGIAGLAYDTLTSGGPFIWVFHGGTAGGDIWVYKIRASTGAKVDSFYVTRHYPSGALGGGAFVTDQAYPGSITLGVLNQGTPHLITGYRIGSLFIERNITVLYPAGGENLLTNSTQLIVWKSLNVTGNVKIEVIAPDNSVIATLASNTPNTGHFSTTPVGGAISNIRIRVSSIDFPTVFGVSGFFNVVSGTTPVIDFPIVVTDGVLAEGLRAGLDPTATDGIDSHLGEYELPPIPPTTVFDARYIGTDIGLPQLGNGTLKDYRQGNLNFAGQKIHELKYQLSDLARRKASTITIYWSLPSTVTGRLQDLVTGNIIDVLMTGTGSYTVSNPNLYDKLKVTYTYTPPVVGTIKVLYPNGGEVLRRGSNVVVAWTSSVSGNVRLLGSTNGGSIWFVLADNIPNTGVYGSTIGMDTPESNQWRIKIESVDNPSIFDISDNNFTIQGTKLVYMDNPLVISDGNNSVGLFYGIDPTATDGLDAALGEAELPPLPPTGVFDGRFTGTDIGLPQLGEGTWKDYRQGGSTFSGNKIHQIQYQMSTEGDSLRLFWYLPTNVTGLLQDFITGTIINVPMAGSGRFNVPNPSILNKLKVTLTYTGVTESITVVQPNGGENWIVGSTQNIVWNVTGGITQVKLQYTTNNGVSWIDIATVPAVKTNKVKLEGYNPKDPRSTIEGTLGTYAWVIPNTPSTQCKVRVSDASNPAIYDESDNTFTISQPTGIGETWTVQSSGTTAALYSVSTVDSLVAWATGVNGVVIRTTNGGNTWSVVTPPRAVDGHVICGISASRALVATNSATDAKIHLTTNGGDSWEVVFTQAGGFINIIIMFDENNGFAQGDPVGGNWTLLRTTNGGLTWTSAATLPQVGTEYGWNNSGWRVGSNIWFGTNNSRVYRSTDLGATWSFASTTVVNSYSITFASAANGLLGSTAGTANRSTNGGVSWSAISTPATFDILGMTTVGGNEFWFTSGNSVFYTSNHGTSWTTGYTAPSALYHLHFKPLSGQNAVGYAVGASGTVVKYFRGPITPTITVISPNGGENWTVGTTRQIVWTAQAVQNVKLEYTTNNGASWITIAASVPAASKIKVNEFSESIEINVEGEMGTYNWVIPNTPSNQCRVRVSDVVNPAVFDVSDNVFTISTAAPGPQLQFNYDISSLYPLLYSAYGSEFDGQYFYLTKWNEPRIFRINKQGTSIDTFNVTGLPSGGFRDLAFDGQFLYGSNNTTTVYRIDRTTFAATTAFTSPIAVRAISFNAAQNAFWISNWSTDIVLVSRTGATLYTIPAAQHGLTGMAGNAYDTLSAGAPYLWVFHGGTATDPKILYKLNTVNGAKLDSIVVTGILPDGAIAGGLWITDQFEEGTVTLGGSNQGVPHRIFGFKIHQLGPIPGTVTVLSPNGGEKFPRGTAQLVTWKSYDFDVKVRIKISSDGGSNWSVIASNVDNTGVYPLQISSTAVLSSNYKIRIEAQSDSTKFDDSDSTFEILPALTVAPVVNLPMVISDNEKSRLLRFGLDPAATDGIDPQFGEEELPPPPPAGILDGRFIGDDIGLPQLGQGLAYDFRQGGTNVPSIKIHELKFQRGTGSLIVINLLLPPDVTARFQSLTPGFDTTVSGVARVVVTDTLLNKLRMTINYFPGAALGTFELFGPINNATVIARENDTTIVTYRWYKARNAVRYIIRSGVPTIPPFMLESLSNINGTDSTFTIRRSELFNIFVRPNYPVDTTVNGQWAVWAFGAGGDSVKSTSTFAIRYRVIRTTGTDKNVEVPKNFVLYQNYPNPFNPSTRIKFGLPQDANVTIEVFNIVGERVATIINGEMKQGYHEVTFDATNLQSGVYFYKITAGNYTAIRKMMLIK